MPYFYKNTSYATNTFYGVTFRPGETKEVPGPINYPKYILVKQPEPEPIIKSTSKNVSNAKPSSKPNSTNKSVDISKSLDELKEVNKSKSKDVSSEATKASSDKTISQGGKTDGTDSNK